MPERFILLKEWEMQMFLLKVFFFRGYSLYAVLKISNILAEYINNKYIWIGYSLM